MTQYKVIVEDVEVFGRTAGATIDEKELLDAGVIIEQLIKIGAIAPTTTNTKKTEE